MKPLWTCLAPLLLLSCQTAPMAERPVAAHSTCSTDSAREAVGETVRAFFAALARDDEAAVARLTTSDFYAYEVGRRYSGPELFRLIADGHQAGRIWQWNIGAIDARIDCNIAFAAWQNDGVAGTAARLEPRAWLESALLVRESDRWVIDFLHSTPKDPRP